MARGLGVGWGVQLGEDYDARLTEDSKRELVQVLCDLGTTEQYATRAVQSVNPRADNAIDMLFQWMKNHPPAECDVVAAGEPAAPDAGPEEYVPFAEQLLLETKQRESDTTVGQARARGLAVPTDSLHSSTPQPQRPPRHWTSDTAWKTTQTLSTRTTPTTRHCRWLHRTRRKVSRRAPTTLRPFRSGGSRWWPRWWTWASPGVRTTAFVLSGSAVLLAVRWTAATGCAGVG